jgi:hypothetical protein
MKDQRKTFAFREDALAWIRANGFYYVDYFGWCHEEKFSAIVEKIGKGSKPWVLTVYKNAVPPRQQELGS